MQVPPVYGVKQGWPASGTNRKPVLGSGRHQVALALPLARITGMRVTPAQKLSAGLTRLRAGG